MTTDPKDAPHEQSSVKGWQFPRWRKFLVSTPGTPRWRRWGRWGVITSAVLTVAAIPFVWWGWNSYSGEAAKIDLGTMRQMREGTAVLDRNGQPAGTLFAENRKFVRLDEVPGHVVEALIATEDASFYDHDGLDFKGIARAMMKNIFSLSVKQGGSTITQQLARQAFELKGRTLHRKILESFVACRIEDTYSKEEILESYLNRIYLGNGFYGIGSAARGYFDKDIKDVSLEEAAMLVGIIKAPVSFSPFKNIEAARRARDLTLRRMRSLNMIDADRAETAMASPVTVLPENTRLGRQNYLLAAVERELEQMEGAGSVISSPWKSVFVSVDAKLQMKVDTMVGSHVAKVEAQFHGGGSGSGKLQGAAIVIDNVTGTVLATCGGRDFLSSPFDRAMKGQRPAGTAFLPLTYAAVLAHRPELVSMRVLDGPLDNRRVMISGDDGMLGEWGVEESRPVYEGYVPVLYGLARGKTGAAVRLAYEAGLDGVRSEFERAGFNSPLREHSSLVLGSSAVRLIDMARAYASLSQGGSLPPVPFLVTKVESAGGVGATVSKKAPGGRVFTETAAAQVRNVLVAAMRHPDRLAVLKEHGLADRNIAGWGGTAHGFTDAWFIGFDREVTCAVWMGYDETRRIGDEAWSKVTAFPLWAEIMTAATSGDAKGWAPAANDRLICLKSGCLATPDCRRDPAGVAVIAAEFGSSIKTTCPGHSDTAMSRVQLLTMEKEVMPVEIHAPPAADVPQNVKPLVPAGPALIGDDPYGAFAASRESEYR